MNYIGRLVFFIFGLSFLVARLYLVMADQRTEVFTLWDSDGDGILSYEQMADAMRCVGQNPTEKELSLIVQEYDAEGTEQYSFETFCAILDKHSKKLDAVSLIREALKVFDTEADGFVSIPELRGVMVSLGEKQDEQQVLNLLEQFETDENGKVAYTQIVDVLAK